MFKLIDEWQPKSDDFKDDLKELSDEETYKVGDEMEDEFPLNNEEKHDEAPISYADLKWEVKDFYETTFRAASNTDAHPRSFEKILTQDKAQYVKGINKILTNLKEVQDAIKEDTELNKKVAIIAQNNLFAKWVESPASIAWSVGLRLTKIENAQAIIQIDLATLKTNTLDIKSMVTEIFYAFKG
nr:hypothetical protein [Tanacetum cinerariifolium]